jgi:FkbM family methyltransferase
MLAARLVGDSGKVLCFEPNSENCRLILLSVNRNQFGNVRLFPVAASNRLGHSLFSTHIGSNGGLIPSSDDQLLSPSCVVVPTFPLDDLLTHERIDVIKMDTEGAEGLVVGGAKALIEKFRPMIVSEFSLEMLPRVSGVSGSEYLSYFQSLGYELQVLDYEPGVRHKISDISAFLQNFVPLGRIADLAFIPRQ